MALTFEAEGHIYKWDGTRVYSVTQILEDVGLSDYSMVPSNILTDAQKRGTRVHLICELWDKGELDLDSLDGEDQDYLDQWIWFKKSKDIKTFDLIESPLYSERHKYAGTLDRLRGTTIYDIKTGPPAPGHPFQLAAYSFLLSEAYGLSTYKRIAVHLTRSTFKPKPYRVIKAKFDLNIFLSAKNVHHSKKGLL